jgi:hypothetical protein
MHVREQWTDHRSEQESERPPWWSRPVTITIRVIAIVVIGIFVALTVLQLRNL